MRVLLDTNVYIYKFVSHTTVNDEDKERWKSLHSKSEIIWEYILDGIHTLVIPSVIKVEIASVLNRKTKNKIAVGKVMDLINILEKGNIVEMGWLDDLLTERSINLTYRENLTANDSVIGASCLLRPSILITNDEKLHKGVKSASKEEGIEGEIQSILLEKTSEKELHEVLA